MFDLRLQVDKYGQMAIQGSGGQMSCFVMACRLWRNSADLSEVRDAMRYYNSKKCSPKFSSAELDRIIYASYKNVSKSGGIAKFRKEHGGSVLSFSDKSDLPIPSIGVTPNVAENPKIAAAVATCHDRLMVGDSLSTRMLKNLAERGISQAAAAVFCLGLSNNHTLLPKWLTIPLIDVNGNLQSVMSKTFLDGTKYIKTGVGGCLFGAIHRSAAKNVLIVEGQLDAVLLWQYTNESTAVVTIGSVNHGIDSAGLKWLQSKERVIIAMDRDAAGRSVCEKWRRLLPGATIATPFPLGKDATDVYKLGGACAIVDWLIDVDRMIFNE